jgi:hypothetical protein
VTELWFLGFFEYIKREIQCQLHSMAVLGSFQEPHKLLVEGMMARWSN